MKKIKRKLAIILSVAMMFTTTVTPVIVQADVTSYLNYSKQAVTTTNALLKSLGVEKMGNVGKGLTTFLGALGNGLGLTNTILKFLGFGKSNGPDTTALMYEELKQMHSEMLQIGQDVQNLANTMSDYIIDDKFNEQMKAAKVDVKSWYDFNRYYVEDGLSFLETQYQTLINDEIRKWFTDSSSRYDKTDNINNNGFFLMYDENGEVELNTRDVNDWPSSECAYIWFKDLETINLRLWDIDTYQDTLAEKIEYFIDDFWRTRTNKDFQMNYMQKKYPILTKYNWQNASFAERDETAKQISDDFMELLTYRLSVKAVNENSFFVNTVKNTFKNYCHNLVDVQNEGLDALLQAIMLTNNFEGEARETYQDICANLLVQTGEYATFALDVIGKHTGSSQTEADAAAESWNHVVEQIQSAVDSLTGYDNYCYATGTLVYIMPMSFREDYHSYGQYVDVRISEECSQYYEQNISNTKVGTEKAMIMSNLFLSKLKKGEDKSFINYLKKYSYGKYKPYYEIYKPYQLPERVAVDIDFDKTPFVVDWDTALKDVTKGEDISFTGTYLKGSKSNVQTNNTNIDYNIVKVRKKLTGDLYTKDNNLYRNKALIANVVTYKKGPFDDGWFYFGPQDQNISVNLGDKDALDCYSSFTAYTIVKEELPETGKGEDKDGYNPLDSLKKVRDKLDTNSVERLKVTKSGNNAVKLSWNKISGATKYVVYGAKSGSKSYKKLATVKGNKYTVKKISGKKLSAHKLYKFKVVAKKSKISVKSKAIYFITGNTMGKYANVKSLKVNETFFDPGVGQTATIEPTCKMYSGKKHISSKYGAAIRYTSDKPSVATVNSKGVITGVSIGTANIYVQDIGGKTCKVKVQVIP